MAVETHHKFLISDQTSSGLLDFHAKIGSAPQAKFTFLWAPTKENAMVTIMKPALQYYYKL